MGEKPPVQHIFDIFEDQARFPDWLFLAERLGKDEEDNRTLTYIAKRELGLSPPPLDFASDPEYMRLELLHSTKRYIDVVLAKDQVNFIDVGCKVQMLAGLFSHFTTSDDVPNEERVVYRNSAADYIRPVYAQPEKRESAKPELLKRIGGLGYKNVDAAVEFLMQPPTIAEDFLNIADPFMLEAALQAIHEYDHAACTRFVKGFTGYADYLVDVAARRKTDGVTMKQSIKQPLSGFVRECIKKSIEKNNTVFQDKLYQELTEILSGQAYVQTSGCDGQ